MQLHAWSGPRSADFSGVRNFTCHIDTAVASISNEGTNKGKEIAMGNYKENAEFAKTFLDGDGKNTLSDGETAKENVKALCEAGIVEVVAGE